jgi:hypothetical protein
MNFTFIKSDFDIGVVIGILFALIFLPFILLQVFEILVGDAHLTHNGESKFFDPKLPLSLFFY